MGSVARVFHVPSENHFTLTLLPKKKLILGSSKCVNQKTLPKSRNFTYIINIIINQLNLRNIAIRKNSVKTALSVRPGRVGEDQISGSKSMQLLLGTPGTSHGFIGSCSRIPWELFLLPSLKLTASLPLKIGNPKRKRESIPTIHF